MARGYISGGGGGGIDSTGSATKPIFINSDGDAQVITGLDSSIIASKATDATNSSNATTKSTTSKLYVAGFDNTSTTDTNRKVYHNASVYTQGSVLYNAAWNDYAEYIESDITTPGTCITIDKNGKGIKSNKRLQKLPRIISDTFGMAIGNQENSSPVAVAGKVLAFHNQKLKVGDVVCSGKNGNVSKMNRLEIILFPDRILGVVCEIPNYSTWNNVEVKDRIWIKIK